MKESLSMRQARLALVNYAERLLDIEDQNRFTRMSMFCYTIERETPLADGWDWFFSGWPEPIKVADRILWNPIYKKFYHELDKLAE